jgi:hypothetical protein
MNWQWKSVFGYWIINLSEVLCSELAQLINAQDGKIVWRSSDAHLTAWSQDAKGAAIYLHVNLFKNKYHVSEEPLTTIYRVEACQGAI